MNGKGGLMSERLTVSWSELDCYRQCPKKHQLAYKLRWSKPPRDDSALAKGNLFHEVKEAWYKSLKDKPGDRFAAMEAVGKCIDAMKDRGVEQELIDLIMWMHEGYVQVYGLDDDWEILAVEHTIIQPLMHHPSVKSRFDLKAKMDLIVRDKSRGLISIVDHKTCTNLPDDKELELNDQFGLYELLLSRTGMRAFNTIHNAARTVRNQGDIHLPGTPGYKTTMKAQPLEKRFSRTLMKRTPRELLMIEQETIAAFTTAYSPGNAHERHTDDERCKRRCSFTEACLQARRAGDDSRIPQILQLTGFEQFYGRQ